MRAQCSDPKRPLGTLAHTTSTRRHPHPPPTARSFETTTPPSCDFPVLTPVPQPVAGSPASAPAPRCDPKVLPFPSFFPAFPDPIAPLRTYPPPASCWILPEVAQSGISAATSDCHAAPASYKSGSPVSHPPRLPAAQTNRPAT